MIDDPLGFVGQRRVDGQVIDFRQQIADTLDRFDSHFRRALFAEKRIETQHSHFKSFRTLGNRLSDSPQPDNAQRFFGELGPHVFVAIPFVIEQAVISRGHVARQGQHQRPGVFRRAQRVAGGRVHHDDAQPRGRFFIDVVGPNASPHDRFQFMIARQHVGGQFRRRCGKSPLRTRSACRAAHRP